MHDYTNDTKQGISERGAFLYFLVEETSPALPTDIPKVDVRQGYTDILFEYQDGRLLHIEFQSIKESTLYRFAVYDLAISERYRRKVRTVVLYTGDVHEASSELDAGS